MKLLLLSLFIFTLTSANIPNNTEITSPGTKKHNEISIDGVRYTCLNEVLYVKSGHGLAITHNIKTGKPYFCKCRSRVDTSRLFSVNLNVMQIQYYYSEF